MFLIIILLFILGFFLRSFLCIKYNWIGHDTFFHLLCSMKIKKSGICKGMEKIIKNNEKTKYYPPLFHVLLSFFSKKNHKNLRFLPTFFDLITMSLVFLFTYFFINESLALYAMFIYAIAPIMILSSQNLNPRTLSNLIFTLSMIFLFLYFTEGLFFYLIFFLILNCFVLLSHRLTTQSLIIIVFISSIIFRDILPFLFLLSSFTVAFAITKGKYKYVLNFHIKNLKRHFKYGHYKYKTKRPENPILLFFSFPFILIIIINIILNGISSEFLFLQIWFFSLLTASFFWIWGDGYRYLTNAVFPGAILSTIYLFSIPFSILIFSLCCICSFIGIGYIIYKFKNSFRVIPKGLIKCFKYIKINSKKSDTLFVYPLNYCYIGRYFSENKTFNLLNYEKDVVSKGKILGNIVNWIVTDHPKIFRKSKFYKQVFRYENFYVFKIK